MELGSELQQVPAQNAPYYFTGDDVQGSGHGDFMETRIDKS
jgi:hypothetical protein